MKRRNVETLVKRTEINCIKQLGHIFLCDNVPFASWVSEYFFIASLIHSRLNENDLSYKVMTRSQMIYL